ILSERGFRVSGCDLKRSVATDLLKARGVTVLSGHDPSHLEGVDAVVVTAAVRGGNAEIDEATRRGIPVIRRKEMLGAIADEKRTVGVSGTHGKTTTTAMIALILEEAGLDPTVLVAAIGVARELGVGAHTIAAALSKFLGVDRRFQILGDYGGALVVDDYAHHPTEIRATLDAARSGYPQRRIVALFQPHLYSRTRDFARQFGESLRVADVAIVAPIYA